MKILLVNPPIPHNFYNREFYLPSSFLYIGAVLQKNGEDVKLMDFKTIQSKYLKETKKDPDYSIYENKLADLINNYNPDLIGLGGLISANFKDMLRFSELAKKTSPTTPIVIGGAHATMYPKEILENCNSIDWLILGEGETSTTQLVEMLKNKNYDFDEIEGFAYRKGKEIKIKKRTNFIKNLDELPMPAYNLIDLKDYYEDTNAWHNPKNLLINTEIPIISSRSCPNDCNFCASSEIMGRGWRPRSAKNVVDEIEYLYNNYGQNHFSFMDDNFTLNKSRLLEICDTINKKKLNIQFETHNGVSINTLDDEIIDAMATAGLTRIALPIESGSDYIRNKVIGKNLKKEKIFEVLKSLRRYKGQIYARAFFIIGMPEDTKETLMETYRMIEQLNVEKVHLTNIVPFPGTRVYTQAIKDNLLVNLNVKDLYKSDELYQTNYDRYFIKPYNMEISELHEFRKKCNKLLTNQKN